MTSIPPVPGSIRKEAREPSCFCTLVGPQSPRDHWELKGESPVTLRIGASRGADWWVSGERVPDLALDLHWDGKLLWVADRAGHGRLTVDGEGVTSRWRALAGGCRLEFPGGALIVDSSRPGVVTESAPKHAPSAPPPVRSDVREVMRPPAMADVERESLASMAVMDEPTRTWRSDTLVDPPIRRPDPNRPRTIVPPPMPPTAAVEDLETQPTREIILDRTPSLRPAVGDELELADETTARARRSAGGR